jgi:short-subunit dehydrogenase
MTQTVVITGASAGIARATAALYGRRQANVALLARGRAGLEGAAADVESGGGEHPPILLGAVPAAAPSAARSADL